MLAAAITALCRARASRPARLGAKATFQASFVTDTTGSNDKSFNHLGNLGRLKAQKELGIQTKVYVSAPEADYLPNAVAAAQCRVEAPSS